MSSSVAASPLAPPSAAADPAVWLPVYLGPSGDVLLQAKDGGKLALRNLYDGAGWELANGSNGQGGTWAGNDLFLNLNNLGGDVVAPIDAHGRMFAIASGPKGSGRVLLTPKGKPLP